MTVYVEKARDTIRSACDGVWVALLLAFIIPSAAAQDELPVRTAREFPLAAPAGPQDLPAGRLRTRIEALPQAARERAVAWLRSFHFTEHDLESLHADDGGGICYACRFSGTAAADPVQSEPEPPPVGTGAVPVAPFPSNLVFHSKPGSPNVLYLNFSGETVVGTEWNNVVARAEIPALPFSTDSDYGSFSDAEQTAIKRVWQRMAEDYAPFDIDVTTERPGTFNTRTAHALITRSTDANGAPNPYSTAGGVAYVNVFGTVSYATYRPAWVYHNNLSYEESYIAEAASHEVGHNLGLSHDGKTDGTEYYGGHGSGDISWGPLMGTGYNRNVTQWCRGEYYLANNTQDDVATIAGKVSYRTDDHGNTSASATALVISGGTNIVSTTPEQDPANAQTANKGVLERSSDADVFAFVTGSGAVRLAVSPWLMPSGTRGGNADILIELRDEGGALVASNNPASLTTASIATDLPEGRYYLHVRTSGAGAPFSSPPTGYTSYGALGQYFIGGCIADAGGYVAPPVAELHVTDIAQPDQTVKAFTVTYSDNVAVDVSTIDSSDIRVTGPNAYDRLAEFVSLDAGDNGTPRTATYAIAAPGGGAWLPAANGTYTVWLQTNQVGDTEGAWVPAGALGQFQVAVPAANYSANMDSDPGWILDPQWQYGAPAYSGGGPAAGFTGAKIVGYNLSGNYADNLSAKHATTPPIDTTGSSTLTLRFMRWLRTRASDTAAIQVSTNGTAWLDVWYTAKAVSDTAWQAVQYSLPAGVAGSASVRLRWSLTSNQTQNDIGWNIDDVQLLGDGALDTSPPVAALSVADVTVGGSPSHSCSVTYVDGTAVRLSSLDSADLLTTGPNGYSNLAAFAGADLPEDGSPLTASYSIPAPGGFWDVADNGLYTVTLLDGAVEDTLNNYAPGAVLGTFSVSIPMNSPGLLSVWPSNGLDTAVTAGEPFVPSSIAYALTNAGDTALDWLAGKTEQWVSLSATSGSLEPGASAAVIASINATAATLAAGDYTDAVSFINVTTGDGNTTRNVNLRVNLGAPVELTIALNNPAWGNVTPSGGVYAAGTLVELLAVPAAYCRFGEWAGHASGTNNPLALTLQTDLFVEGVFYEVLTTNYPTPHWWLADYGYTNDQETAVTSIGANGMALWQSYVAGLIPTDPVSQFSLTGEVSADRASYALAWSTVTGRFYTLDSNTNLFEAFTPLPGATNMSWTVRSFTNILGEAARARYYRIRVSYP